ncbi:sigma 54 modulation/S30EA ribosomal C-terminal domain-containing protein [Nonomuraea bangladeshensis]|uniref:Sigma 54 modulation/S30EA ribosomal C-terminal domain-containing protein n=1 Tax=Nonomuraea bangladeshensis TaxID=404385 RepID=A0ABV3H5N4_9ACTN
MRHRPIALDPADVQIKIRGGVRPGDVRRARQTVAELSRLAHGEPRIVRVLSAVRAVPDEAVVEMDQLDHDFLLFVDPVTGGDCLVHRTGGGYRLVRLDPRPELPPPTCAAVSVATEAAPRLSVAAAVERLELGGFPYVFFADAGSGAGQVVYRRADGAYGLVTTLR